MSTAPDMMQTETQSSTDTQPQRPHVQHAHSSSINSPLVDLPENRKNRKRNLSVKDKPIASVDFKDDHSDWPYELVLVRHGQSEGNEAVARSKLGDLSAYTPDFQKKHSSSYRLTDKGIEQAKVTGKFLREKIGDQYDRYYTSEYVRAMETAALLELPSAQWYTEITLRERDKGLLDNVSWIERNEKYGDEMRRRKRDAFFWAPPGGESLAQICQRIDHTMTTLRRDCSKKKVIIVCHGEIMWGFRVRLERLSQIRFHQMTSSDDLRDKIHNTQILQYTRVHPKTGEIYPVFKFMRSICPWKPEYGSEEWLEFERPTYSNEDLMHSVQTVPRYVNNNAPPESEEDVDY